MNFAPFLSHLIHFTKVWKKLDMPALLSKRKKESVIRLALDTIVKGVLIWALNVNISLIKKEGDPVTSSSPLSFTNGSLQVNNFSFTNSSPQVNDFSFTNGFLQVNDFSFINSFPQVDFPHTNESGINKKNNRDESAEGPNIDNQVLEASSFSSRVFIHDYPKNPRIEAQYKSKGRTYISYYNITALGTYSIIPKLTQKPNCNNIPQYPILDNYIVETEIAERGVKCETKYVSNSKVNYTVAWKERRAEWSVNSTKSASAVVNLFLKKINWKNSKLSGPRVFRFDIEPLYNICIQMNSNSIITTKKINWKNSKLSGPRVFRFDIEPLYNICIQMNSNSIITTKVNKQIRPFEDITSHLQQYKRLKNFGKDVKKTVDELIVKHKLTDSSEQSIICSHYIEFEYKENQIQIKFKNLDSKIRLDAVVRVYDEALLGRDGYRHLAAVIPSLFREYLVADRRNEINKLINAQIPVEIFNIDQDVNQSNTNNYNSEIINDILVDNNEIGNGAFCSLVTLLKILILIWKKGENPVIIPGDTLYIKLGGDGRNVGRKQNHEKKYLNLINNIGKETYEILDRVGKIFALQLIDLKQNGIIDEDGNYWSIEFFFSGDWKFLYIIMGLNAPNSNYFCLYCEYDIKSRHNMNLSWLPTGNKKENKKSSIFPVINLLNYIPNELHTLLRLSDILMESLFKDLFRRNNFERNIKEKIEKKMSELNIHFEFYRNNSSRSSWSWTSLMGPDKKKMLQHFPVSEFISGVCGIIIENLWKEFYQLYEFMRKPNYIEEEILTFENNAKNWVKTFSQPARGQINTATAILGIYREEDVTSYMHMLTMHIPFFIRQLKEKNLAFRLFSTSSIEKKNHCQVRLFFGGTTMGGGKKNKPVVYDILVYENRKIFYLINDIPNEITYKNINICE
ncbi:hypothetical protein Glove_144g138 [Diversispora epigaea]|uniref:Uncharacterized protein n=1 Tax=Diversispora epigaea TaxID=1348612 RepID=A0A397J3V5_9GLOM|nr:hypothetical protein Glove_144g138 [Diversispora epigaea]